MSGQALRVIAFIVLALLGAPVAMHVVVHDLHDHEHAATVDNGSEEPHGDHEHPVVSSAAPRIPSVTRIALAVVATPDVARATWTATATADRNVVSFGALRMDDDVGLHSLHSTFLI
jgi:hypothetical protein